MLVLSQPQSRQACSRLLSIVDILSPSCDSARRPTTVTAAGLAYLTALHTIKLTSHGTIPRSELGTMMLQHLENP